MNKTLALEDVDVDEIVTGFNNLTDVVISGNDFLSNPKLFYFLDRLERDKYNVKFYSYLTGEGPGAGDGSFFNHVVDGSARRLTGVTFSFSAIKIETGNLGDVNDFLEGKFDDNDLHYLWDMKIIRFDEHLNCWGCFLVLGYSFVMT